MILKVGLTGGIASGKSTVARLLAGKGCFVVDADRIVHDLYRPGAAGYDALLAIYGDEILANDGTIDRRRLSELALSTAEGASKLNGTIHPLVIEEQRRMFEELAATGEDRIGVVEATLLIESGGRQRFDRIIVVDVDPDVQLQRGRTRGMDETEVRRRIARQISREERLRAADYVVPNNGDLDELARNVDAVYELLTVDLAKLKETE